MKDGLVKMMPLVVGVRSAQDNHRPSHAHLGKTLEQASNRLTGYNTVLSSVEIKLVHRHGRTRNKS